MHEVAAGIRCRGTLGGGALFGREQQWQAMGDLIADRGYGVAFSLVDPQLQTVFGHKVWIVLAELIDLRGHVPQGGVL